jgi:hypothetical protein
MSKMNAVETKALENEFAGKPVTGKYDLLPTKSAKIRAMTADGFSRSQIKNTLNISYQHVRNVQLQPLKK